MANKKNAVFRCEAAPHIGGGHVMRCLTLADALKVQGWECGFACGNETLQSMPPLRRSGYTVLPPENIGKTDLLVFDHYGLDQSVEKKARGVAERLIVIDDLADRKHDCDLLIDCTYGRAASDYKSLVPGSCKILAGAEYAMLRPQFAILRPQSLERRKKAAGRIENILIFFGTMDHDNMTSLTLKALSEVSPRLNIDIVLRATALHSQAVADMARSSHHNVKMHSDVDDMASLMTQSDLALGAGGTTSWERCCLGLPTLAIAVADNQNKIIAELAKAGAIVDLGTKDEVTGDSIANTINELYANPQKMLKLGETAGKICDGGGVTRILKELNA